MQNKMLIVVSGPDRVGKSTLISSMVDALNGDAYIAHHGAPPSYQENIFDFYRKDVDLWDKSGKSVAIFDRAWPCSYILEQHRRHNAGHFEDVVDLEIEFSHLPVVHLAQLRPWHWSAPLHLEELREEFPGVSPWFLRDQLISRMQEHKYYTEQLLNFYEDVSLFPNVQFTNSSSGYEALETCRLALSESGT